MHFYMLKQKLNITYCNEIHVNNNETMPAKKPKKGDLVYAGKAGRQTKLIVSKKSKTIDEVR